MNGFHQSIASEASGSQVVGHSQEQQSQDSSRSVGQILAGVAESPASLWGAADAFRSPVERARAAAERRRAAQQVEGSVAPATTQEPAAGQQDRSHSSADSSSLHASKISAPPTAHPGIDRMSTVSSQHHKLATMDDTLAEAASVRSQASRVPRSTAIRQQAHGRAAQATGLRRLEFPQVPAGSSA